MGGDQLGMLTADERAELTKVSLAETVRRLDVLIELVSAQLAALDLNGRTGSLAAFNLQTNLAVARSQREAYVNVWEYLTGVVWEERDVSG